MEKEKLAYPTLGDNGMTLRDYFAGQIAIGLIASGDVYGVISLAEACYEQADAMLKVREEQIKTN